MEEEGKACFLSVLKDEEHLRLSLIEDPLLKQLFISNDLVSHMFVFSQSHYEFQYG